MRLIRIHASEDGGSSFQDFEIELQADALGRISRMMPAGQVFLRELKRDLVVDYHRAPQRQLIFFVAGGVEVESSDGARRAVRAGDAILADDIAGKGHITRAVDGPVTCVYVPVPPEFDVTAFCRAVTAD
jgi:quercetin dioxygenase-like cupin family protein